jgi:hypothetical protein
MYSDFAGGVNMESRRCYICDKKAINNITILKVKVSGGDSGIKCITDIYLHEHCKDSFTSREIDEVLETVNARYYYHDKCYTAIIGGCKR